MSMSILNVLKSWLPCILISTNLAKRGHCNDRGFTNDGACEQQKIGIWPANIQIQQGSNVEMLTRKLDFNSNHIIPASKCKHRESACSLVRNLFSRAALEGLPNARCQGRTARTHSGPSLPVVLHWTPGDNFIQFNQVSFGCYMVPY